MSHRISLGVEEYNNFRGFVRWFAQSHRRGLFLRHMEEVECQILGTTTGNCFHSHNWVWAPRDIWLASSGKEILGQNNLDVQLQSSSYIGHEWLNPYPEVQKIRQPFIFVAFVCVSIHQLLPTYCYLHFETQLNFRLFRGDISPLLVLCWKQILWSAAQMVGIPDWRQMQQNASKRSRVSSPNMWMNSIIQGIFL